LQFVNNKAINSNNISGEAGVSWDTTNRKWIAQLGFENSKIYGGRYKKLEDAVRARRELEVKHIMQKTLK